MNWKFWQWPARIQALEAELVATRANANTRLPQWSERYDVAPLRARLAQLPADDQLRPLLLGYVDAAIVGHAGLKVPPEMANQLAGKLNALDELRTDLEHLWHQAHQPPKEDRKA